LIKEISCTGLVSLAICCLLCADCTVHESSQPHLYTDPQFGFRLASPDSGWILTDETGIPEVLLTIKSKKMIEDFIPNVTVAIEPLSMMMTAEEYGQRNLRSLKSQGYEIISSEKRVIHHNLFCDLHCLHQDTQPILRFRHLCLVKNRVGFIITCTAPENCYHMYENDFKLIVNSFRFM